MNVMYKIDLYIPTVRVPVSKAMLMGNLSHGLDGNQFCSFKLMLPFVMKNLFESVPSMPLVVGQRRQT